MSAGLGGFIDKNLWGSPSGRNISNPNLFSTPGTVGNNWGNYLNELYKTPTTESTVFRMQSSALRDALALESDASGEQFSQALNAGGAFDSGARLSGLNDINRNRMVSFTQGLTEILARLEQQKMEAAFPFLQAQIGEFSAYQGAKQGAENAQTARSNQSKSDISNITSSFLGSMGGG